MLVTVQGGMGPLCPRTMGGPLDPLHAMHNLTLDAFYNNTEKDVDGEMGEEVGRAYNAAANVVLTDRMDLHYEAVNATNGFNLVVGAWFFKCRICGLILSARARPM